MDESTVTGLPSSSIFSQKNSRLPEDTVFYAIYPDSSLSPSLSSSQTPHPGEAVSKYSFLQSLHLKIVEALSPHTSDYIWQHEPFTLSVSSHPHSSCICSADIPHLHGKVRFGDNLEDEWFAVFLLFEISRAFPSLSIRGWDTDGEFLLIEAAYHLPRWVSPDNSMNRVFIRSGDIFIVPRARLSNPSLADSLSFLATSGEGARASGSVQSAVKNRISEYPERAWKNVHRARVRVPLSVAQVLKREPCLISLAVEGFYDRDIDTMKYAGRMEKFLRGGRGEELVRVSVKMSRAMYAQLAQQTFQAPKRYPMPPRSDASAFMEAELGMKIACGFEMMYQHRLREGSQGKGRTWDMFRESLEKSGYFEGLLPGSQEYKRLMESAEEYYRNSSLFSRASEMMSAPVRRIDEILALPCLSDDFGVQDLHPPDDDSWLYDGEEELNSALQERQKEMELYDLTHKHKQKSKEHQDPGDISGTDLDDFDIRDIAKSMQAFVDKVSSYEGAEVPESRKDKAVDFDVDSFMRDVESVGRHPHCEETSDAFDHDGGSSSDMDFDDSEDGSIAEDEGDGGDAFMHSYSNVLEEQLKDTAIEKSFVHADGQTSNNPEGGNDEEFRAVDVDANLVKSLLDSFSSQEGLPGPASNLLGLMGLHLPPPPNKGN